MGRPRARSKKRGTSWSVLDLGNSSPGCARARSLRESQETAAPEQPRPATSFSTYWWPFLGSLRPRRNAVLRPRRPHGRSRGTEAPATDAAAPGAMPRRPDHLPGLLAAQLGLDRALYSGRGGPGAPNDTSANRHASRTSSPSDNPRGIRGRDSRAPVPRTIHAASAAGPLLLRRRQRRSTRRRTSPRQRIRRRTSPRQRIRKKKARRSVPLRTVRGRTRGSTSSTRGVYVRGPTSFPHRRGREPSKNWGFG